MQISNKSTVKIFIAVSFAVALFTGCKKDERKRNNNNNTEINAWILDNMKMYYLWNKNIPESVNYSLNPKDFFYSLLFNYKTPDGDRFSWIQENYTDLLNMLIGVTNYDVGFEYMFYGVKDSDKVFAEVLYVKNNTHARNSGIKRGQMISHVNGIPITLNNYKSILSGSETTLELEIGNPYKDDGVLKLNNTHKASINKVANYAENPVYLDTVYIIDGKTIGYLVYNFFAAGVGENGNAYDLALNDAMARFAAKNINYLVLDLRYNSGGSVMSSNYLASMLHPSLSTTSIYLKATYNKEIEAQFLREGYTLNTYFQNKITNVTLNNIGSMLESLYILTSSHTASASEMVINGLHPYCSSNLKLIGETTVGKNVGSISIYDENNSKNKWGMQPIVVRYANSTGFYDFKSGFTPDIVMEDYDIGKKELGDVNENLLNIAIHQITGQPVAARPRVNAMQMDVRGASLDNKPWRNKMYIPEDNFDFINK